MLGRIERVRNHPRPSYDFRAADLADWLRSVLVPSQARLAAGRIAAQGAAIGSFLDKRASFGQTTSRSKFFEHR